MSRLVRAVVMLAAAAVAVVVLVFGVFPTRTWLNQRESIAVAEEQLDVLERENAQLEEQVARLQTDEEIEHLAREHYHLVMPGEEAYALLPPRPRSVAQLETAAGRLWTLLRFWG